jgi:hypothetical protein
VVARCIKEGLVGGEAFAVDASMNVADAYAGAASPRSRRRRPPFAKRKSAAGRQCGLRLRRDGWGGLWTTAEIEQHVKLMDKSERNGRALSRSDFVLAVSLHGASAQGVARAICLSVAPLAMSELIFGRRECGTLCRGDT